MSYQKRNQLLEIIQEKQLDDAESRIKRLLIRFEQFEYDNKDEN